MAWRSQPDSSLLPTQCLCSSELLCRCGPCTRTLSLARAHWPCCALQPDTSRWSDGFFFVVAGSVAPWLAYAVLASALLANMSTLQASLAAYSRTLQAVAREGFLPIPLLARNQVSQLQLLRTRSETIDVTSTAIL